MALQYSKCPCLLLRGEHTPGSIYRRSLRDRNVCDCTQAWSLGRLQQGHPSCCACSDHYLATEHSQETYILKKAVKATLPVTHAFLRWLWHVYPENSQSCSFGCCQAPEPCCEDSWGPRHPWAANGGISTSPPNTYPNTLISQKIPFLLPYSGHSTQSPAPQLTNWVRVISSNPAKLIFCPLCIFLQQCRADAMGSESGPPHA